MLKDVLLEPGDFFVNEVVEKGQVGGEVYDLPISGLSYLKYVLYDFVQVLLLVAVGVFEWCVVEYDGPLLLTMYG